jgi:exodeoxyribonuclease VII large subunit
MEQLSFLTSSILSVKELTSYLHGILESDAVLRDIWVTGEVSNLSRASSGHVYFTLKDPSASIRCAMWRQNASRLSSLVQDGQSVEAHGYVDIYEVGGQLQFYVDTVRLAGEGLLYQEFLQLKARLEAEGLFDESRKRPLPLFPHRLGIVTSPTGAALQDILNVLQRRFPLTEVILSPAPVQGDEAPKKLISALKLLLEEEPDVIILARGGGSLEDLSAFNDESLTRAIAASPVPVITGIGHETDFTIADFVADLRAPTPTAAAEMAVPNKDDLLVEISEWKSKLHRIHRHIMDNFLWQLSDLMRQLNSNSPALYLTHQSDRLVDTSKLFSRAILHTMDIHQLHLKDLQDQLIALSPQATLDRGFSLVTNQVTNQLVTSVNDIAHQLPIKIQVSDGTFNASVVQEKLS